jgi:hypothetical protein
MSELVDKFRAGRSPREQLLLVTLLVASVGLVAAAEVDVQRRPAGQVRGSRLLWRLVCLNAIGAASYFRWGRRATPE